MPYTPTTAQRLTATATTTDTFTITANNGVNSVSETVVVPVGSTTPSVIGAIGGFTNVSDVVTNPNGNYVYVVDVSSQAVSVISTATNTAIATISLPNPINAAVSPDGNRLYVTNWEDNTVSVVDTTTNTVTATIALTQAGKVQNQAQLVVSPDGKYLYAANQDGTVSVIDTTTNAVTASIPVSTNYSPGDLAVSPDGRWLYRVNSRFNVKTVEVIDTASHIVSSPITVTSNPNGLRQIALSHDGRTLYVTTPGGTAVVAISTATNTVVSTISMGGDRLPYYLTISPDGNTLYASSYTTATGATKDVLVINI